MKEFKGHERRDGFIYEKKRRVFYQEKRKQEVVESITKTLRDNRGDDLNEN